MAASTAACEAVSGRLDEETPSQTMATRVSASAPMATASSLLWCRCPLSVDRREHAEVELGVLLAGRAPLPAAVAVALGAELGAAAARAARPAGAAEVR